MKLFQAFAVLLWFQVMAQNIFSQETRQPKNVAIFIFNDVQIIDYTGPYEVFVNASSNNFSQFNVFTVAETTDPVKTVGDMTVIPAYSFSNHPRPDVLVIPGGWGVSPTWKKPAVRQWIKDQAAVSEIVLSVCNGAVLLATAGLLDSLSATSTSGLIDDLAREVPGLKPVYDKRFVDNGKIITSAGLTAGIDGALHVVERMLGIGWAQRVAVDMEYNWQPGSDYARALLADQYIPPSWWLFRGMTTDPVSYTGDRDEWTTKEMIHTGLNSQQIMDTIIRKIEANKNLEPWERRSLEKSQTGGQISTWVFINKHGEKWDAVFQVEPMAPGNDKLLMTASIRKINNGSSD